MRFQAVRFGMRLRRWGAIMIMASVFPAPAQQTADTSHTADAEGAREAPATLALGRERVLADIRRLPRYTCVQTITRRYYRPLTRSKGQTCAELIAAHEKRDHEGPLQRWDRLRLEVAVANNTNVYSWVGAPKFDKDEIDKLAGRGPLGTGDFGPFLSSIFEHATVEFQQTRLANGQRQFEYAFEMPLARSGYHIKTSDGWAITAYSGTFLLSRGVPNTTGGSNGPAGPDDVDIVRLIVKTAELPENTGVCQAISEVDYGRKPIHDRLVLIPRETRLLTIGREGGEISSVTAFDRCREWGSTIKLSYGAQESSPQPIKAPVSQPSPSALPAGVRFECRIVTPIDSDTSAAGDPIQAVLSSPIHDKKHGTVAPAGAHLNGRLMRVEQQAEIGSDFQIGVQWESLEVGGQSAPLRAVPAVVPRHGSLAANFAGPFVLSSTDAADGIGTFIFPSGRSTRLLRGLDSAWVTISSEEKATSQKEH
jgi:hypothetical protein